MSHTVKRYGRLMGAAPAAMAILLLAATAGHAKSVDAQTHDRIQTILDEREIERLIADYCWLLDAKDFEGYGALFSDGALLDQQGRVLAKGTAQVTALARHYLGGNPEIFVRHLVSNVRVDVAPDGKTATASSFMTTIEGPKGKPASIFRLARYEDSFLKIDGRWKFRSRQEPTDWVLKERQPPATRPTG